MLKVDSLGITCGVAPCDSIAYPIGIAVSHPQMVQTSLNLNPVPVGSGVWELYYVQGHKVQVQVLVNECKP